MAQAASAHDTHANWQVQARRADANRKPVRLIKPRRDERNSRLAALASAFNGGKQQQALETGIFG